MYVAVLGRVAESQATRLILVLLEKTDDEQLFAAV
jgi:hypothetical protein